MFFFLFQAFEDIHIDKNPILKAILEFLNYTFAVTFCVEMILKLLAFGIVGYFTNLWNCLDSFIVAVSTLLFFISWEDRVKTDQS